MRHVGPCARRGLVRGTSALDETKRGPLTPTRSPTRSQVWWFGRVFQRNPGISGHPSAMSVATRGTYLHVRLFASGELAPLFSNDDDGAYRVGDDDEVG